MPNGVPLELTSDQAALYSAIGSMIGAGIGADRAYGILRDTGNTIPRATVRAVAGEIRTSLGLRAGLARAPLDNPISAGLVSQDSSLRSDNFVHRVAMILYDPITLTTFTQFRSYVSPDLATPSDIFAELAPPENEDNFYAEFPILSMSLVSVSHR